MRRPRWILAVIMILATHPINAMAEAITGRVTTAGNPGKRWTLVAHSESEASAKLCRNDVETRASKLTNGIVTFQGTWSVAKDAKTKCFEAHEFLISEIAPGRPAITGLLTEDPKNQFSIINQSGKRWQLAKISPGLRDLKGRHVIADLVAADASSGTTTWLVARMYEHP